MAGKTASGNAGGGLAGAGPFEDGADTAEVLDRAGEIGMAGAGPIDLLETLDFGVLVDHLERQRATERDAVPET